MKIRYLQSPNLSERRQDAIIDTLVIHHTNMDSLQAAIDRLCNRETEVSAHYIIGKDGSVYQLVSEEYQAWHCGESYWRGKSAINDYSIGIELDNNGSEPFPNEQIENLIKLCHNIMTRHDIKQRNIVGHSDIAPHRKDDPHHLFPWKLLAKNNIGIFPEVEIKDNKEIVNPNLEQIGTNLSKYGYYISNDKQSLYTAIEAFKRHFCPESFLLKESIWDQRCEVTLINLKEMIGKE